MEMTDKNVDCEDLCVAQLSQYIISNGKYDRPPGWQCILLINVNIVYCAIKCNSYAHPFLYDNYKHL
jgi:hypothetical protein